MIPKSVRSLRIDINSGQVRKSIAICQQDSIMPTINAMLVEGGKALDLTEVLWAEIFIHKADGYEADNGCVIDGESIQYSLHSSDVSAVGINTAQFQLTYKDGSVITTPTFEIVVYQKVLDQRVQQSMNEYTSLSQMVVQANAYNEAAAASATNAAASATSAEDSATSAATSATDAASNATAAASSAEDAADSATAAAASATDAASSATAAATSASNAATSASSANDYKITAVANAALAQGYASDAKDYKDAAAGSATAAANSAAGIDSKVSQAAASATAAAGSAAEASGYLATVKGYADAAEDSATAAESASSSAFGFAEDCEAFKDAAAASATAAASSASNAKDYKDAAALSATDAAASATNADDSADDAAASATNAAGSATDAASSANDALSLKNETSSLKDSAEYYAGKAEEAYEAMAQGTLVLGETSTTAYRGDHGKAAYDHSQIVSGNPHGTTYQDVGADAAGAAQAVYTQATGYTDQAIANLINGAPQTLDTLKEIADAMAASQTVVEALQEAIGSKAAEVDFTNHANNSTIHITSGERTNWNEAYGKVAEVNALHRQIFAHCTTAASTKTKVITLDDNVTLKNNDILNITFQYTNSYDATSNDHVVFSIGGVNYAVATYQDPSNGNYTYPTGTAWTAYGSAKLVFYYKVDVTNHVLLHLGHSVDSNTAWCPQVIGFGYGTCSTAESTAAKVVTLTNYNLITHGMVAVKFTNAVPAAATMNINSKGAKAIYFRGAAITANVIAAGDTALFIYDGSHFILLAIDNTLNRIATLEAKLGYPV